MWTNVFYNVECIARGLIEGWSDEMSQSAMKFMKDIFFL
jgi:hypothetical protein